MWRCGPKGACKSSRIGRYLCSYRPLRTRASVGMNTRDGRYEMTYVAAWPLPHAAKLLHSADTSVKRITEICTHVTSEKREEGVAHMTHPPLHIYKSLCFLLHFYLHRGLSELAQQPQLEALVCQVVERRPLRVRRWLARSLLRHVLEQLPCVRGA